MNLEDRRRKAVDQDTPKRHREKCFSIIMQGLGSFADLYRQVTENSVGIVSWSDKRRDLTWSQEYRAMFLPSKLPTTVSPVTIPDEITYVFFRTYNSLYTAAQEKKLNAQQKQPWNITGWEPWDKTIKKINKSAWNEDWRGLEEELKRKGWTRRKEYIDRRRKDNPMIVFTRVPGTAKWIVRQRDGVKNCWLVSMIAILTQSSYLSQVDKTTIQNLNPELDHEKWTEWMSSPTIYKNCSEKSTNAHHLETQACYMLNLNYSERVPQIVLSSRCIEHCSSFVVVQFRIGNFKFLRFDQYVCCETVVPNRPAYYKLIGIAPVASTTRDGEVTDEILHQTAVFPADDKEQEPPNGVWKYHLGWTGELKALEKGLVKTYGNTVEFHTELLQQVKLNERGVTMNLYGSTGSTPYFKGVYVRVTGDMPDLQAVSKPIDSKNIAPPTSKSTSPQELHGALLEKHSLKDIVNSPTVHDHKVEYWNEQIQNLESVSEFRSFLPQYSDYEQQILNDFFRFDEAASSILERSRNLLLERAIEYSRKHGMGSLQRMLDRKTTAVPVNAIRHLRQTLIERARKLQRAEKDLNYECTLFDMKCTIMMPYEYKQFLEDILLDIKKQAPDKISEETHVSYGIAALSDAYGNHREIPELAEVYLTVLLQKFDHTIGTYEGNMLKEEFVPILGNDVESRIDRLVDENTRRRADEEVKRTVAEAQELADTLNYEHTLHYLSNSGLKNQTIRTDLLRDLLAKIKEEAPKTISDQTDVGSALSKLYGKYGHQKEIPELAQVYLDVLLDKFGNFIGSDDGERLKSELVPPLGQEAQKRIDALQHEAEAKRLARTLNYERTLLHVTRSGTAEERSLLSGLLDTIKAAAPKTIHDHKDVGSALSTLQKKYGYQKEIPELAQVYLDVLLDKFGNSIESDDGERLKSELVPPLGQEAQKRIDALQHEAEAKRLARTLNYERTLLHVTRSGTAEERSLLSGLLDTIKAAAPKTIHDHKDVGSALSTLQKKYGYQKEIPELAQVYLDVLLDKFGNSIESDDGERLKSELVPALGQEAQTRIDALVKAKSTLSLRPVKTMRGTEEHKKQETKSLLEERLKDHLEKKQWMAVRSVFQKAQEQNIILSRDGLADKLQEYNEWFVTERGYDRVGGRRTRSYCLNDKTTALLGICLGTVATVLASIIPR